MAHLLLAHAGLSTSAVVASTVLTSIDALISFNRTRAATAAAEGETGHTATENPHLAALKRDMQRYFDLDLDAAPDARGIGLWWAKARLCLATPGLHATLIHRYGHWVYSHKSFRALWYPAKIVYRMLDLMCSIVWGVHLDPRARIGGGLYIGHADSILVGPVTMGVDCTIGRQVTIGRRANGSANVPEIGDRAYIGISSVIFGGIRIGDGVTIGPLTVVGRSLPSAVLVTGNPLKVLRTNYDNSVEIYGRSFLAPDSDDAGLSASITKTAGAAPQSVATQ
jgi:serine O-acetyltransferase